MSTKYIGNITRVHERVKRMPIFAFVASVSVVGVLTSFLPVSTGSTDVDYADYHYVPYAGDVFGA